MRRTLIPTLLLLACHGGAERSPARLETAASEMPAGHPIPLSVIVKDSAGAGKSGVSVTWRVTHGAGSVAPSRSVSDRDGRASATWTVGPDSLAQ